MDYSLDSLALRPRFRSPDAILKRAPLQYIKTSKLRGINRSGVFVSDAHIVQVDAWPLWVAKHKVLSLHQPIQLRLVLRLQQTKHLIITIRFRQFVVLIKSCSGVVR